MEIILTPENHILLRPLQTPDESTVELRNHLKILLSQIKTDSPVMKKLT